MDPTLDAGDSKQEAMADRYIVTVKLIACDPSGGGGGGVIYCS